MRCPKCDYDLTGLPEEHICPECGLAYDPHCKVLRLQPQQREWRQVVLGAVLIAMMGWASMRTGFIEADGWMFLGLLFLIGVSVYRIVQWGGTPFLEILNKQGVTFERPGGAAKTIAWAALKRASASRLSGKFRLRGHDGKRLLSLRCTEMGGVGSARACAGEINGASSQYT